MTVLSLETTIFGSQPSKTGSVDYSFFKEIIFLESKNNNFSAPAAGQVTICPLYLDLTPPSKVSPQTGSVHYSFFKEIMFLEFINGNFSALAAGHFPSLLLSWLAMASKVGKVVAKGGKVVAALAHFK